MPGIQATMREFKGGSLKSSSGQRVTNPKQAIAIGLSEDRKAGKKVPPAPRKKGSPIGRAIGKSLGY